MSSCKHIWGEYRRDKNYVGGWVRECQNEGCNIGQVLGTDEDVEKTAGMDEREKQDYYYRGPRDQI